MLEKSTNKISIDRLSKIDYWKRWRLFELFAYLREAKQLLERKAATISNNDVDTFKELFVEELGDVGGENVPDFTRIWEWFTPNKKWDEVMGDEGKEIGQVIFNIADQWKRNWDFYPKAKVSCQGEFGVVLDKPSFGDTYGIICWDTEKENDLEDWGGLFGSFQSSGGQIIDQDHQFVFINDDGSKKSNG